MKKNIVISLIALCVSFFAWGQTPNPVERRLYIEYNKEKKPVKITLKEINDKMPQTEWPVKDGTAIIKTDEVDLNLGKIYHNTGKSVQFKVKENDDSAPINEPSTNHTDQPLTVKTGNTYDFYNGGNKPFLTIIVKRETHPTYDFTFLSADSLKIGKDTLTKDREDSVFTYEIPSDRLLFISNWPKTYHLSLNGHSLNPKQDNRLCCGDTVRIEEGKSKSELMIREGEVSIPSGIPTWVTILLAILALLIFIALLITVRRERVLQSNAKLMEEDIKAAEDLLSKIQHTFSPKGRPETPTAKDLADLKENDKEELPVSKDPDETTSDDNPPKQEVSSNPTHANGSKGNEGSGSGDKEQQKKNTFFKTDNISKLSKVSIVPEKYNSKKFPQSKGCIINNTIPTFIADFQEKENEIENANRIIDVILAGNKEEEETTRKELVKDEGKANEIVKRILNLKDELINVSKPETSEDKDAIAKWKTVEDILKENLCQQRIGHLFGEKSKHENYANKSNDNYTNNSKRNRHLRITNNITTQNDTQDNYALYILKKFLKEDLLKNILDNIKDGEEEILNSWIVKQLGDTKLFQDVKQTQEKNWITYLEDKFNKKKELTEDQKEIIINQEIDNALKKNVGNSPVLRKIIDGLIEYLDDNNITAKLSKDKDNITLQSFATLLNSIPQSDDEMKEEGAKEIFNLLKKELRVQWDVTRESIGEAVQAYFDNRVIEKATDIIKLNAYKHIVESQKEAAQEDGKKAILENLKAEIAGIVKENRLEATIPNEIKVDGMKKTLKYVFEKWHQKEEKDSLDKNKDNLLVNSEFKDALKDVKINSFDLLINILAELVKQEKKINELKTRESQELRTQIGKKDEKLKNAEQAKEIALQEQKTKFDEEIRKEKEGRRQDNNKWQEINNVNIRTIQEYHLTELTRIKWTMDSIDEQLRSAYNNFDRNTPLGKMIDSFIKENTYYSLDKFLRKIENIGGEDVEMSASMLTNDLRGLYKECLNLAPPTWIDVLTRLYCYTDVPFIAEEFEKENLDCQAIRQAFFTMKNLLSDINITITYPRLFRDKLNDNYKVKQERNIDNILRNFADRIKDRVKDRQTIIDLYTVGFQIADEEPRRPEVSIF